MTDVSSVTAIKTVLVTGASSGIGEATARYLASKGHPVVLGARRIDRITAIVQAIQEAGGEAFAQELDVTDLDSVGAFVAAARGRYGRVDVLVQCGRHAAVLHGGPAD
jgi:NADP-dependent 3-hydroxy acid dehydrogenase YdfG